MESGHPKHYSILTGLVRPGTLISYVVNYKHLSEFLRSMTVLVRFYKNPSFYKVRGSLDTTPF